MGVFCRSRELREALHEVHILRVTLHVLAATFYIAPRVGFRSNGCGMQLLQFLRDLLRHIAERLERTAFQGVIRRSVSLIAIITGWLQTGEWFAFALAMDTYERLEKPAIGQLESIASQLSHGERSAKRVANLLFVLRFNPYQSV